MGTTLRICLAMGGGVSLGTFSGSSLTESLKLLLLYGKDSNNKPYDKIIIDGMSGASAGAVAMTILMRCLIDYKSMMHFLGTDFTEKKLINEIANNYFINIEEATNYSKIEELKALQVAQKIQYKVWVEELDAEDLYGDKLQKDYSFKKYDAFGLLDKKLLEELTRKYLMHNENMNLSNRQLLDKDRVIFVCSLTNLLPIEIASSNIQKNKLQENILKSTGSQNHSELRIIDFIFNQDILNKKDTDSCWLQFSENPEDDNETHFNIHGNESWATLAASALACSAFPIAFEPVILKRFKNEFGYTKNSQWPQSFTDIEHKIETGSKGNTSFKINSFFDETENNEIFYDKFNFPYIDGGTFNNEPIKEAFRIGAFQDFGRSLNNEERLVLFVDPIVREDYNHSFKISSYSPIKTTKNNVKFNTELSKIVSNISTIISVLRDQGSIKEEHKIKGVQENLDLRKTIFEYLNKNGSIGETLTINILTTAFEKIYTNLACHNFSLGTRDPLIYFIKEIEKICTEKNTHIRIKYEDLDTVKKNIKTITSINEVYTILKLSTDEEKNIFAQTVFRLIIDFSLNTDGKSTNAIRAAILPINKNLETINLPGSEIEAFAGFASKESRIYAFEYGKLSSLLSLKQEEGFRKNALIKDDTLAILETALKEKILNFPFFSKREIFKNNLKDKLFNTSFKRIKGILLTNKFIAYILLKVPFIATSLFGTVAAPVYGIYLGLKSIFSKSPWKGTGFINNFIETQSNSIDFMNLKPVTFSIVSDNPLPKKLLIQCEDNKKVKKIKVLENKFIDKKSNKERYQYLFNLYLLKYLYHDASFSDLNVNKISSDKIAKLGLSLNSKVKIPLNEDGIINPEKKWKLIEENYTNRIEAIRLGRFNFATLIKSINNENSTLFYSVRNINYHVNPIIEFDVQQFDNGWYFIEKTESLDKKILRASS